MPIPTFVETIERGAFVENPFPQPDPQCTIINVEIGQATCSNAIIRSIPSDQVFHPNAEYDLQLCVVPWDFIYLKQFIFVRSINQVSYRFIIEEKNQIVANYTGMPMDSGKLDHSVHFSIKQLN